MILLLINGMTKAQNELTVNDLVLKQNDEVAISVNYNFDNDNIFTAYSFDIVLPVEFEFAMKDKTEVAFIKGVCHDESHVIMSNLNEKQLNVAGLSMGSKPLNGCDGILLQFTAKPKTKLIAGQVLKGSIQDVILVNLDGIKQKLAASDFTITITGLSSGILNVEDGRLSEDGSGYYDLYGQKVTKPRKGIYIKNKRKVISR